MNESELFSSNPYSLPQSEKEAFLLPKLSALTQYHREHCPEYTRLLQLFWDGKAPFKQLADLPYLPVNLFKTQKLLSISPGEVFKVLRSSGTTSSQPSQIFLDSATAHRQTLALANIMTSFLGPKRLPMVVIDHPNVIADRNHFNARGAAILGMLNFGREPCYALDAKMHLNLSVLKDWMLMQKHREQPILFFGLTFVVWEHFLNQLQPNEMIAPQGILIHTGGWKKMQESAISPEMFKQKVHQTLQINHCHNFYGMVEQVGSVFMECEQGFFHCPRFAEVIIRRPKNWQKCDPQETGVIQVLSILPSSYPGHSLLTEDLGRLKGIDDCACGRKGKYFEVLGRVPQAEIRGCSDTLG